MRHSMSGAVSTQDRWDLERVVRRLYLLVPICLLFSAATASAMPINIAVPANALIQHNGKEWAWAAPCNPILPSCGVIDLTFQGPLGWHIPTAAEFAIAPLAPDFVFAGANVPLGGVSPNGATFSIGPPPGDAACAAPFFSTLHTHR